MPVLPWRRLSARLRRAPDDVRAVSRGIIANSHEGTKARRLGREVMDDVEALARIAIDCGMRLHRQLGPGLLESAYETILFEQLRREGLAVERQKAISIDVDRIRIADAFRADLLVENVLLIEIKSADRLAPVHVKQVLTYLKLLDLPLGLLMNFGQETLRDGLRRVVNGPATFVPSRLRANLRSHEQDKVQ